MTNQVSTYQTGLTKINNVFMPMIQEQLTTKGIMMTEYQKKCVLNSLSLIDDVLNKNELTIHSLNQSQVTQILLNVAMLELNASATPNEIYYIVRGKKGNNPVLEMGIEGDGNDSILRRFGANVKTVYPHWSVRENDEFIYPRFKGLDFTPPEWSPRGTGKIVKVVYPIEFNDGSVRFYIAEREDVKRNLMAHISNNLMWDKGNTKKEIFEKAENMTLDEILNDDEIVKRGKISKAWAEPQSREQMIERKMRNNIVKKIPKDFSSSEQSRIYQEYQYDVDERPRKIVNEEKQEMSKNDVLRDFSLEMDKEIKQEEKDDTEEINNVKIDFNENESKEEEKEDVEEKFEQTAMFDDMPPF